MQIYLPNFSVWLEGSVSEIHVQRQNLFLAVVTNMPITDYRMQPRAVGESYTFRILNTQHASLFSSLRPVFRIQKLCKFPLVDSNRNAEK